MEEEQDEPVTSIADAKASENIDEHVAVDESCSQNCGVVDQLPSSRMEAGLKGRQEQQGAWPWVASVARRNGKGTFEHLCTAVLISSRHMLSTAECFDRRNTSLYVVRIGHVNRNLTDEYNISRIAVPPTYQRRKFYDDLAVLTLSRDVNTENASPICLPPSPGTNLKGKITTSAGWIKKQSGLNSIILLEIPDIPVISNQRCHDLLYSKLPTFQRDFPQGLTDGIICAGFLEDGRDTCEENSGSPLMYQQGDHWCHKQQDSLLFSELKQGSLYFLWIQIGSALLPSQTGLLLSSHFKQYPSTFLRPFKSRDLFCSPSSPETPRTSFSDFPHPPKQTLPASG
ncbi:Enteropeptidase [Araneus ventricosus]|uniref:Enteropeptidase n=1 Tax=Araneus ventricosus TaxID=182803 RepID=A0A4Y2DWC5_ARAVE|nr:Enteropeptidase [Araneus ventricosus]